MALSNLELVGRALEQVSAGLEPFITETLSEKVPPGRDWTLLLAARDARNGSSTDRQYSPRDVQVQLRALTEKLLDGWYPFQGRLSRAESSLASELRDIRNGWAHQKPMSTDDAYRALDTSERLLRAVNAPVEADAVRAMRVDLQRREFAGEANRARKARSDVPHLDYGSLPPWRDVLRPRVDIARGQYAASEFAADLHEVATGRAAAEYLDPVEFFRRTYLTEGLKDLLRRAARRVSGDRNADPVVNLQTNFGGGKTHSMLAVWHLLGGTPLSALPQDLQETLAELDKAALDGLARPVARAAIVGNKIPPGQPLVKDDGTRVHTLWGELAWQLGGREAYEMVRASDEKAGNPGEHLGALLAAHAPCAVLIDEWVAYARGLHSRDDLPGGTFETQFSFAQTLTEAVAATPGALLLVSIPASDVSAASDDDAADVSDLEVGGAHGRAALERLQNVVGRYATEWTPASSQESFEIVRRRLFEEPSGEAMTRIAATARAFGDMYRKHSGEFPRETADPLYEGRIRSAFPLHPELFERLYSDWSSLQRFQRTRGVLRLMSAVVHSLHESEDNAPLIMPGSMPLDSLGVRDEIAKYLADNWKPIIDTDIDGTDSTPVRIDAERPLFGGRSLTRRIARTIFMGSAATLHTSHKGIERPRLFLGVAQPGDTVGNFGSSLQVLSDRAAYLYADGDKYWFDTQPSLNRQVTERAESLAVDDVWAEAVRRLEAERRNPGKFADVLVAPTGSGDVSEAPAARLVILHPGTTHAKDRNSAAAKFAEELITRRGTGQREKRNLVVALAADTKRSEELEHALRQYIAWNELVGRATELDLTASNKAMAERRRDAANRAVKAGLAAAYIHLMYATQPDGARPMTISIVKVDGSEPQLAVRTSAKLVKDQQLVQQLGARNIRMALDTKLHRIWNKGHISAGELWTYYGSFPYLDRLCSADVLYDAVRSTLHSVTWQTEGFALATGYDERTGDYEGLVLPGGDSVFGVVGADTLLVSPQLASAQKARESAALPEPETPTVVPASDPGKEAAPAIPQPAPIAETIRNARYSGSLELDVDGDIVAQLRSLAAEILLHLQKADPDSFEVSLRVRAEKLDGFDDWTVRTVRENAANLGLESGFEDA